MRDVEWRPREIPMYRPQGAAAREVVVAPPRASRSARRRARRYNPNRHLEREDYVSARESPPPPEDEAGPPCRRVRPDEPRRQDNRHVPGGTRVRLQGIIFGGLNPVPTDPSIDPPPYHCFNCWQPDHFSGQCPRSRVRLYCRNCGRHGEDLNSCPRCGKAHAEHEWRAHREALARAQQMPPQHHVAVVPPGHAQVRMGGLACHPSRGTRNRLPRDARGA